MLKYEEYKNCIFLKFSILFLLRDCLLSTSSCLFSLATWVFSPASILSLPLCYCSTTSQRSAQMPTSSASSSTSPFLPLWPTWEYGRSEICTSCKDVLNDTASPNVCLCLVLQPAFEVLSFISVMSNCWLLLLSPRVKEFTQEAGLSTNKVLVIAVIVEVREDFGTASERIKGKIHPKMKIVATSSKKDKKVG